ncbi:hypothetical protein B0J11DRAFT_291122 [Dendryphion nanum]|uniref:Methyltransferase type 11 domain-containing protein n=1 Tax=Dendryphion nanum TaxID=256645 RepID=A0A9P9DX28_9PLEO|nr:hypothetical protein B0J11DRAFT_291122 [Dendryphion nanum]
MASYKSHLVPPRRGEEQPPYTHRAPTTRLPQRSITPTSTITSHIPTSSHSKLQKRRPSRDEQTHLARGITGQRAPVPKTSVPVKARTTISVPTGSSTLSPSASTTHKTSRQASSSRLPKLEVSANTRTPSLVSGSSASTVDSPGSNVLRRKPSSIGVTTSKSSSHLKEGSLSSLEEVAPVMDLPGGFKDPFSETVLGISLPPSSSILAHSNGHIEGSRIYDYEAGPLDILPLPTPQYALSSTPSTRYSESPGPFSISSTPTSMSSYSPGVALSTKSSSRIRQTSPLQSRPPVTRHRTPEESTFRQQHSLSSVRESSTSSSSASTVLGDGIRSREKRSAVLPAPPPSPPTAEIKRRVQAPPELAHLADPPALSPEPRRPIRPSRDGTHEIVGLREPSPIIHSNMTSFPSSHRRTSSSESRSGMLASGKARFGIPSKSSSRNPSPNPSHPSAFPPSRVPTRGPTPDVQRDIERQRPKALPTPPPTVAPAPAPSPSKSSRFGFFRRTKTEPTPPAPKTEKKVRRGPAAGTGHEGYGRYALRGRSGSSVSGVSIGRSASAGTTAESLNRTPSSRKSSMTSTTSGDMDDFFLDRLNPVVIRGTGSSTELSRSPEPMHSASSLDLNSIRNEDPRRVTANHVRTPVESNRPTLLPSAMSDPVRSISPQKKTPLRMRRPSDSEDEVKRSFLPSLTTKRASRASKMVEGASLTKVTSAGSASDKGRKGSDKYSATGKEGNWLTSKSTKKEEKASSKPSKKWNFFQRAHATPRVDTPVVETSATATSNIQPSRSMAHYALVDTQSGIDMDDIEQLMREADSATEDVSSSKNSPNLDFANNAERKERLQSILLPPMPILPPSFISHKRSASPKVYLSPELQSPQRKLSIDTNALAPMEPKGPPSLNDLTPVTDLSPSSTPARALSPVDMSEDMGIAAPIISLPVLTQNLSPPGPPPTSPPPRPSRLPQVGRIPQVVSSRNQPRRPPSQSFSRPFVADQPRPSAIPRTSFDSIASMSVTAGPVAPYPILQGLDALSHGSAIATMSPSAEEANRQSEFFKFPPRKDSEVSYSSSSGIWSFPPTVGTAIVPNLAAPQSDDEVWNEYDDLIDEVLSPFASPKSTTASVPTVPMNPKTIREHPSLEPLPLNTKISQLSTHSGSSANGVSNPSLHLRRSRLLAVLHAAQSPTSSVTLSEVLQEYGEKSLSVVDPKTGRLSFPSTARMSTGSYSRNRPSSTRSSLPASLSLSARQSRATLASTSDKDRDSASANRYRDTRLMEIAETQADGLVSMANLRFGALMTSKWLSFGRVLFSPAHFELKDPLEDRVLVIDGLGKDWSYYCALTYPEATVYNLGPGSPSSATTDGNTSEPWSTLRNHRHISHSSLATAFPFPRGFFACVVLRFPPALPSSVHRSIVSECKRVLRPGGHLEISVLDLDLINMGNRARRAVRSLKVKMQVADEHISLRNISDEIMASLGRKGFTECNRCFVGVPVGGKLPNPDENDGTDGKKRKGSTASSIGKTIASPAKPKKQTKPEVSFSDLLNAQASSESLDDGIADMVARVGRWWYSRCYESLVLPEAGEPGAATSGNLLESSIWRDENLIRECEKRGTTFRLLIGYAQKPEVGVRRTVSV